jgi:hypothetical protein
MSKNDIVQFLYNYVIDKIYPNINILNKDNQCKKIKTAITQCIDDVKCDKLLINIITKLLDDYKNKKILDDYFSKLPTTFIENIKKNNIYRILIDIKILDYNPSEDLIINVPSNRPLNKSSNIKQKKIIIPSSWRSSLINFYIVIHNLLSKYTYYHIAGMIQPFNFETINNVLNNISISNNKKSYALAVSQYYDAFMADISQIYFKRILMNNDISLITHKISYYELLNVENKQNIDKYTTNIQKIIDNIYDYNKTNINLHEYFIKNKDDLRLFLEIPKIFDDLKKDIITILRNYNTILTNVNDKLPLDKGKLSDTVSTASTKSTSGNNNYDYKPYDIDTTKTIYTIKFIKNDMNDTELNKKIEKVQNTKYWDEKNDILTKILKHYMGITEIKTKYIILYIDIDNNIIYIDDKYKDKYLKPTKENEIGKFIINKSNVNLVDKSIDEEWVDVILSDYTDEPPFTLIFPTEPKLQPISSKQPNPFKPKPDKPKPVKPKPSELKPSKPFKQPNPYEPSKTKEQNKYIKYFIHSADKIFKDICKKNQICNENKKHILNSIKKINKDITIDDYYIFNNKIVIDNKIKIPLNTQYLFIFKKEVDFYNDDIKDYKFSFISKKVK